MTTFRRFVLLRALMLSDLCVLALAFALASLPVSILSAGVPFASFLSMRVKVLNIFILLGLCLVWHGIFSMLGLYHSKRLSDWKSEMRDVLWATFCGTLVIAVVGLVFQIRLVTPVFLLAFWAVATFLTATSRLAMRCLLRLLRLSGRNLRHMLVVGTNPRAVQFARMIEGKPELGYRLIGFVDEQWAGSKTFNKTGLSVVADLARFSQFIRERVVDEVVLALPMKSFYSHASQIAALCQEQGVIVRFLSQIFDLRLTQSQTDNLDEEAVVTMYRYPLEGWPLLVKRSLDILMSLLLIAVFSPLFLIVGLIIRLTSNGPVFFVQERVGRNKRRFQMYKFRTMVADAEKMQAELERQNEVSPPAFKIRQDPRITPVGRVLRRTSIDELPQLFNVLKGDMSLVGPRPLAVRDYLGVDQDWQRRRFSVRPGITCLWQINGRSTVPFDQWMHLDMQYIDRWSIWLDLTILARTIPAILRGTGAA